MKWVIAGLAIFVVVLCTLALLNPVGFSGYTLLAVLALGFFIAVLLKEEEDH